MPRQTVRGMDVQPGDTLLPLGIVVRTIVRDHGFMVVNEDWKLHRLALIEVERQTT
jgi:hypothetical protein